MSRFYGFISRWKNPFLCMLANPLAIWKMIFLNVMVLTWFIFRWTYDFVLSSSNRPNISCNLDTRRPYRVLRRRVILLLIWWYWYDWVFWVIWFILIRYIHSNYYTFASFFLLRPPSQFWYWLLYRQYRMHHRLKSLLFCISTYLL